MKRTSTLNYDDNIRGRETPLQQQVLNTLGNGAMTCEALSVALNKQTDSVRPRIRELETMGLLQWREDGITSNKNACVRYFKTRQCQKLEALGNTALTNTLAGVNRERLKREKHRAALLAKWKADYEATTRSRLTEMLARVVL